MKHLTCSGFFRWYIFWLAVALILYWPGLIIFPQKDHPLLMLGRHLAEGDFRWFLDMLAYNRTRILQPGDHYSFRPLHLGIVALEDILFRYDLRTQGVICCSLFAFCATSFFVLIRSFSGLAIALALTFLWISQLAGADMALWQHINPYIIFPAGLCLAVRLLSEDTLSRKQAAVAGCGVLAACLTHELGIVISVVLLLALLIMKKNDYPLPRQASAVFSVPLAITAVWGILDMFVINRVKEGALPDGTRTPLAELLPVTAKISGAAGIAMFSPEKVKIQLYEDGFMLWPFLKMPLETLNLHAFAVGMILLVCAGLLAWRIKSRENGAVLLGWLIFFLVFWGVTALLVVRCVTNSLDYLHSAPYYFSLLSLALCGLIGMSTRFLRIRFSYAAVVLFAAFLGIRQAHALRVELKKQEPAKVSLYAEINRAREQLDKNPDVCMQGVDDKVLPYNRNRLYSLLFQDVSCTERPKAMPLYLSEHHNLVSLHYAESAKSYRYHPVSADNRVVSPESDRVTALSIAANGLVAGQSIEFTLERNSDIAIIINGALGSAHAFRVDHNTVFNAGKNLDLFANALTWVPGRTVTTYKIAFSGGDIILLGNNRLLSVYRNALLMPGEPIIFRLKSKNSQLLNLSSFRLSDGPSDFRIISKPIQESESK